MHPPPRQLNKTDKEWLPMTSTNRPDKDQYSEDRASPSGQPFDIVEPDKKDITLVSSDIVDDPHDGYVRPWRPIPRLKELLERLFPPR